MLVSGEFVGLRDSRKFDKPKLREKDNPHDHSYEKLNGKLSRKNSPEQEEHYESIIINP